jgi:hypothetical protein
MDTSRIIFQARENFFQFALKLKNDFNNQNYYGLRVRRNYKSGGTDTTVYSEWLDIESIEFILTEDNRSRFSKKHLLFSDRYFSGTNQELRFGVADLFAGGGNKTVSVELYVSSFSENAFNYYSSLNEHLLYQSDPFSQPTLLRGNVTNAFGAAIGQFTRMYRVNF